MTTPLGTLSIDQREARRVTLSRHTRETDITLTLDLDGAGAADVRTAVVFYDHLL